MKFTKSKLKWVAFVTTSLILYAASRVGKITGEIVERDAAVASLNGGNKELTW